MIGTIIWLVGLVLAIKAALEIWKTPGDSVKRILLIIAVLLTSWVGIAVYYFYAKNHIADWVK